MKQAIQLFIATFLVFATLWVQNASAADNFDWADDLRASFEYDRGDEDLEISIYLDDIRSTPDERYDIEVEINNRDYDKRMSYSSSRDEVYADFDFSNVDEDDLKDYLDLDIVIRDEDGDRVFDGMIEMSGNNDTDNNNDNLDWEDTEFSYSYNEDRERLTIKVELEDITRTPRYTYTVELEADRKDYDERMFYSSTSDRIYANLVIDNVDEDEVEDYLDIDVQILDSNDVKVFDDEINLESYTSSNNNSSSNSKVDWSELESTVTYEKDKNRLRVRLEVRDIDSSIGEDITDYDVELKVDGRTYYLNMFYSASNRTIYTNKYLNVFSESRVNNSYNIWIVIEDEDNDEVYSRSRNITTNKNGSSTITNSGTTGTTTGNTVFTNSQIEVIAFRYIYRVEAKYTSRSARIAYLNRTIQALEANRYSYSNKALIDGMIRVMRERITSYGTSWTSGSTWGSSTTTKVNKAATIKPDWRGGTFKYVWGYNY